jgi:hypothetical protein
MSDYINEYTFTKSPKEIKYYNEEPLKLTNEFRFFHNKNKFRKELNNLQYLFKDYLNFALHAPGIRDSFLKEEYSRDNLIIILTTPNILQKANAIYETCSKMIESNCFYLKTTSEYMFLLAKNMTGLRLGLEIMYDILKQTLDDYLNQKQFNDYIKIRPFEIYSC